MSGQVWEKIPEGWEGTAFLERVLSAGYCRIDKILDGTVSIADVFAMHEILDYRDFRELKAREKVRGAGANGRH